MKETEPVNLFVGEAICRRQYKVGIAATLESSGDLTVMALLAVARELANIADEIAETRAIDLGVKRT